MKRIFTATGCVAGLVYGGAAAMSDFLDSPFSLLTVIVTGVGAVGASVGWLLGLVVSNLRPRSKRA